MRHGWFWVMGLATLGYCLGEGVPQQLTDKPVWIVLLSFSFGLAPGVLYFLAVVVWIRWDERRRRR